MGRTRLVVILLADPIINNVFFKIDTSKFPGTGPVQPGIDPQALMMEIAGMTNLIAAITGPVAILSLVIGGIMYILGGNDEEKLGKAKKIIMWSLIGIVLIYGAFALVSTFIMRKFEGL
ncbi:MAG: pilin [Patescibacteria group bacterium]